MKKLNAKGFTLIELLAVVTIMGILMLVAIPSVSRAIENSRRDTFASNAKGYVSAVRNAMLTDSIECQTTAGGATYTVASALGDGTYYFPIATANHATVNTWDSYVTSTSDLMESGGKSSFGNAEMYGYVAITKSATKTTFQIILADTGSHGIGSLTSEGAIKRSAVAVSGVSIPTLSSSFLYCKVA